VISSLDLSSSGAEQTIAPPSNFQEWASGQALYSTAVSLVLPEGVEIGHRYKVVKLLAWAGWDRFTRFTTGSSTGTRR
jgi:hypothetical protein